MSRYPSSAAGLDEGDLAEVPIYRFDRGLPRQAQHPWSLSPAQKDSKQWDPVACPSERKAREEENEGDGHDDPCAYLYEGGHEQERPPHNAYNSYNAGGPPARSSAAAPWSFDTPPGLSDWSGDQRDWPNSWSDSSRREWPSSHSTAYNPRAGWCQAFSDLSTWSLDATRIGVLSPDGHTVAHTSGPKRQTKGEYGESIQLNSLTLLCSSSHHPGGLKTYNFCVSEGCLGRADGVGFAFDTCVRRRCIKDMHTVFYSANGRICVRSGNQVRKLDHGMPNIVPGALLQVTADLDNFTISFLLSYAGSSRQTQVNLSRELRDYMSLCSGGGFLCCVVSETCVVNLW
eukprot:TRINITY_DN8517_c0_g2_i1.p1 TRINITY_DN8517_c0_g2~~TRINITY_DN8517_c0_g2_i1.p1  ORF type:complete len:344 (-),score=35.61 TRINITY_DN8517_c0_g2_i1:191-1222(-)